MSTKLFKSQFNEFSKRSIQERPNLTIDWKDRWPMLEDATVETGFDRHYIYHTAWAARVLQKSQPQSHVDIGSSLYFAAIASAHHLIKFYDFRPPLLHLDNLECAQADLTALPFKDNSLASISCMHVIEHLGLGRYGDPLNPSADLSAASELTRVLSPSGQLLLVTPLGAPRVQFNAHRVYSKSMLVSMFPSLHLESFTLIPESPIDGGLIEDPSDEILNRQVYACGCFLFRKKT